jgi:pSer/pThr/pTyr-binding forkhead associated (FHA) protein
MSKKRAKDKKAAIVITNGCFAGLEIGLEKEKTTLGRDIECDVCLDHGDVSAEHAVIRKTGDAFVLEDLGGGPGTKLNGTPVERSNLRDGDLISIGSFELKFSRGGRS